MKLKVCGLSKPKEVKTCISLNVNYCGFILNYSKSHRFISFEKAEELTKIEKGNSKFVGVLVNPSEEELNKFSFLNLDYFQLYGNYNNQDLKRIKKRYGKKIINTIQIKKRGDIYQYEKFENEADIILWDSSGYEKSLSWDYNLIKKVSVKCEKMIAGNITIDKLNFLDKLADAVDVSGALETNKVKDIEKIKKFTEKLRKIGYAN